MRIPVFYYLVANVYIIIVSVGEALPGAAGPRQLLQEEGEGWTGGEAEEACGTKKTGRRSFISC